MVTVILPGFSVKNKNWLVETADNVRAEYEVRPIFWNHWEDPGEKFDPRAKADDITDILLDSSANIIAKSIGTLVAAYVIEPDPERFNKIIFCGIPFNDINEFDLEVFRNALRLVKSEKFVCFQNENDPHGDYNQALNFFQSVNPKLSVIKKERGDHEYPYYSEFRKFLRE